MRKKISKLAWALLILASGLTGALTPRSADALTCREIFNSCLASCAPEDQFCGQDCQCQYLNCRGYQCN
ncbi:MAG TPA: hypothetical protein VHC97_19230 [Thermoanaerobaculia bacterium]|jgi:hypothetical protein|nr:hypothetical protein [Thermoanaerobaculia bacterium]